MTYQAWRKVHYGNLSSGPGFIVPAAGPPPSFPVNGILDNFNRANEGPPPSASWGGIIETGNNGLRVLSNQLVSNGAIASGYLSTTYGPDTEAYYTLGDNGDRQCLCIRLASVGTASPTGYCVMVNVIAGALQLFRIDGGIGSRTQLGSNVTETFSIGDKVGITVVGSTLTMYYAPVSTGVWGAVGTPQTDSTLTAAGKIGLYSIDATTGNGAMDDLGGGSL